MDLGGVHQYRVVAKSIVVRERKQMKSKKIGHLKENDIVDVKVVWKNTAMVTQPLRGWIDCMSAKGELMLRKINFDKDRKDSLLGQSSISRNTSSSDLSSRGSTSLSQSRSLSKTPEPHRNEKFSELEGSILLIPSAENNLVMVSGYYGTIIGKAYNGDAKYYTVLLDGQDDPVFMIRDDITFLANVPEDINWEEDSSMKRKYVRRCTKHNRYSSRVPVEYSRKRLCRHNYRVRFNLDNEEPTNLKRAESFTIERPIEKLGELKPFEVVSLLNEMMKRDLYDFPDRSKLTEAHLNELKNEAQFQEAYLLLQSVC